MKRYLITLAAILALSFVWGSATAQTTCPKVADNRAHACWTAPTTMTDGTPIVLAITYTVQRQSGSNWVNEPTGTNITATDWTSPVLSPGTYTYRVIAIVGGVESAPSQSGSKTATNPAPNPPSGVVIAQVTITIPVQAAAAYRIVNGQRSRDVYAFVPAGRECYGNVVFNYNGRAYRRVQVNPGELLGSGSTAELAAPCG